MDPVVAERERTAARAAGPAPPRPIAEPTAIAEAIGGRGAIELRGLTKRYGDETVVNAVAISIAPGEFFSLLGPLGCGKTTTVMMVAGLVCPERGAMHLACT